MANKKHILIFTDWYKPGYKAGGPIQSVANIVEHLQEQFYFSVVTRNTDLNSDEPYSNIQPNKWIEQNPDYRTYYISKEKLNKELINDLLKEKKYHAIYLNSLFSYFFTILPLQIAKKNNIKVILAPRGMLGAGALQIKKFKKSKYAAQTKIKSHELKTFFYFSFGNLRGVSARAAVLHGRQR